MGRRKKGNPVHGWVILDKPQGMTSTQAVAAVRRIFDAKKAGHAGTLDPMATGILAIALGEATKTVPYAMDAQKTYRFTAAWGMSRDSDDAEGAVTGTCDKRPSRDEILAVLPRFTGVLNQTPPAYSAIKVGVSGPMTWPGTARRWCWNLARWRSMRPACWTRPPTRRSSKSVVAKALTYGPGCAILRAPWALWAMFRRCAGLNCAPGMKKTRLGWIPLPLLCIVPPLLGI
jgi:hypothetical protein